MAKQQEKQMNDQNLFLCTCGSDSVSLVRYTNEKYVVICDMCGHTTKEYDTKEEAQTIWNKRQKSRHAHVAQWKPYNNYFECSYCGSLHKEQFKKCPICHSKMRDFKKIQIPMPQPA